MIKRLMGRLLTPFSPKQHDFTVGYDRDTGQYFPSPRDLDNLDEYELQKQACNRVNVTMEAIRQLRRELCAYDGTGHDKNPKEYEVAVTGLEIGGREVDATHSRNLGVTTTMELRLRDPALGDNFWARAKHLHGHHSSDSVEVRTDQFDYNLSRPAGESYAKISYKA